MELLTYQANLSGLFGIENAKLEEQKERLVFLDESSGNIDMTRRYGRAVGKEHVHGSVPLNTPKAQTILASQTTCTMYAGGTTVGSVSSII